MNLHELINDLIVDTKGSADASFLNVAVDSSVAAFAPELLLCATIVLMLLVRVFKGGARIDAFYIALVGTLLSLAAVAPWRHLTGVIDAADPGAVTRMEIFTGMLVYDTFGVFIRMVLIGFLVLFVIFTKLSGIPDKEDGPDIYSLALGATLGMCLMATANHLLMVFMAVEMASVPSYVLAGMLKGRRRASEAALKYSIYGAGAAGVMLYGISLLSGILDSVHLPTMAAQLAQRLPDMPGQELMVLALGGLMVAVGLAFKLSAVPFHFWAPDVFEGATAEVGGFLSIASKAAALALLVRVALGFGSIPPEGPVPGERSQAIAMAEAAAAEAATTEIENPDRETTAEPNANEQTRLTAPAHFVALQEEVSPSDAPAHSDTPADHDHEHADDHDHADHAHGSHSDYGAEAALPTPSSKEQIAALAPARSFMGKLIAFLAVLTCTFGNLAAYGQTNIKRLMAYSTIAHAGYMMMPIPALLELVGRDTLSAESAVAAMCIYLGIYLFMNLGSFAVIAFLRNEMGSEEIADYAGLIRRAPVIVVAFSILLFSLVGLPPLAGFIGKFAVFAVLVEGYRVSAAAGAPATYLLVVLLAGGLNSAISLFYYLRVVKTMTMDPEPENRRPFHFSSVSLQGMYVCAMAAAMVVLFIFWNGLSEAASAAARNLLS
ncbi:NADH-quinone oxidoreductase subunit N [Lignipirellula cremea]|uniref:NADH-quinone oxidoreductase subunit N n=1 Tax=Lignipirellula cremea TaxID=2528010 RepID=A0A518DU95_9BACT|nr:NADH-quinone oxidoreductase subunit N [Lignipirellula cremea]QDU95404.1 NADH-quinone oxidoreductase subunit N [Lignipirellula cremea]